MGGKEIPINHSINGRGKILVFRLYCELMQSRLSQGGNLTFVPLVQKRALFPQGWRRLGLGVLCRRGRKWGAKRGWGVGVDLRGVRGGIGANMMKIRCIHL